MGDPAPGKFLLCQSCGMPLAAVEHFGTRVDNTPSGEYCCFCYRKGCFTDSMSLAQKIAESVSYHNESEQENGRTLTRNELSVRMHVLLPKLKRWKFHDNSHTAYYEAVNRVLEFVDSNYDKPLQLKSLVEVSHISQFHFHRIFRAVMGEAPGEYLQRIKLEKAAFMLSQTLIPVWDIALKCGYQSPQALTRAFRRRYGVNPVQYRKSPVEARFGADESARLDVEPRIVCREDIELSGVRADNPLVNPGAFSDAWRKLFTMAGYPRTDQKSEYILLSQDCSTITRAEHYRIYACISPRINCTKTVDFTIEGGDFAVFTHRGHYGGLAKLYCHIYRWWIPYCGYKLRDSRYFEKFLNSPTDNPAGELLTEVWIPVVKK
ncbi:MAG: helix-turn-helix domain-containing protein [Alistipes sp.]|nr:helix-turn-helix domain-containing protein [Alistipes sp.]